MSEEIEILPEEYLLCRKQARRVASKWRAADPQDIEADLLLWLCENYRHVVRYRTEAGGPQKLGKALYRYALGKAKQAQEAHNGRRLQDEWAPYTKEQIKACLPYVWDYEDYPIGQAVVDPRHGGTVAGPDPRAEDALCMLIDVRGAVESLRDRDQRILRAKFRDARPTKEIAQELGLAPSVVSRRVWDAVDRIHLRLGESVYRSH